MLFRKYTTHSNFIIFFLVLVGRNDKEVHQERRLDFPQEQRNWYRRSGYAYT